jgi:hypothetical protein
VLTQIADNASSQPIEIQLLIGRVAGPVQASEPFPATPAVHHPSTSVASDNIYYVVSGLPQKGWLSADL